jgi:hypothetical protein
MCGEDASETQVAAGSRHQGGLVQFGESAVYLQGILLCICELMRSLTLADRDPRRLLKITHNHVI